MGGAEGPVTGPCRKRLAIPVPDHALEYGGFEGKVGMGGGSGAVIVWDRGAYLPLEGTPADEHFTFLLDGDKLQGKFAMTQTGPKRWLLVKAVDGLEQRGGDITAERPESVLSGRTWEEVAAG